MSERWSLCRARRPGHFVLGAGKTWTTPGKNACQLFIDGEPASAEHALPKLAEGKVAELGAALASSYESAGLEPQEAGAPTAERRDGAGRKRAASGKPTQEL